MQDFAFQQLYRSLSGIDEGTAADDEGIRLC